MTQKSAAAVAGSKQPQPCAKKNQRVSIFNPFTNKMARVSPYSAKAKKIYKYYIEELDYDPAWVAPKDLKFYEDSGRFRAQAQYAQVFGKRPPNRMKNDGAWLREQVASWTAKNRNTGLNLTITSPPPSSDEEHEEDEEEAELPSGRIAELHDLKDSVPSRFLNMVYEETALRVEVEKEKRQLGRKGQSVTMAEKVCSLLRLSLCSCC
jgi:hypothetical protein